MSVSVSVSAPAAGLAAYSLLTFRNSQGEKSRGTLLKLSRSAVIFEVYNADVITQLSEVLQELTLWRETSVVYQGRAIVNNLVNTGVMLIVSATLIEDWRAFYDGRGSADDWSDKANYFLSVWRENSDISPGYRVAIDKFRMFLMDTQQWLEQEQASLFVTCDRSDEKSISNFLSGIFKAFSPKVAELLSEFELEASKLPTDASMRHKVYAQRNLHPYLMCSPFVYRTYIKPLGYAGDYEMVNMMVREPYEGDGLFAKVVNAYSRLGGLVMAHRNRIDILSGYISKVVFENSLRQRRSKIFTIGCGPAVEIQRFIKDSPLANDCSFYMLDFNDETIRYTRSALLDAISLSNRSSEIVFIKESVHELIKKSRMIDEVMPLGSCDFVYCAGLFDYLSDKVCSRLISVFLKWVCPGGVVLITNVNKDNTSFFWMEYIVEWYLTYRTNEDVLSLSPVKGSSRVFNDNSGQNIFLEILKPGG